MKLTAVFSTIIKSHKKAVRKSFSDQKQQILFTQGKEQFQKLLQRGLKIPVVLL